MVISGAVSGNVVLNEAEGWPALSMAFYSGFIGVILVGLYVITNGEQQSLQNAEDNLQLAEHDGERCDLLHGLSYLTHPHASSTQLCRCLAGCQPVRCASGKSALVNPPTRNARSTLLTGNDRGRLGRLTPLRWRHLKMAERS